MSPGKSCCLVDSVDHVLVVFSITLVPTILPSPLLWGPPELCWCLTVGLCMNCHQVLEEVSLMMTGLSSDLLIWQGIIRNHFLDFSFSATLGWRGNNHGACMGFAPGPLYTCCACALVHYLGWSYCWTPNKGNGADHYYFGGLWDLFSPTGLSHSTLICWYNA